MNNNTYCGILAAAFICCVPLIGGAQSIRTEGDKSNSSAISYQAFQGFTIKASEALHRLNNLQLRYTCVRSDSKDNSVFTTEVLLEISYPKFRQSTHTTSASGKVIEDLEQTYDGTRHYILQSKHRLKLSYEFDRDLFKAVITNPLSISWLPLFSAAPDLYLQIIGGGQLALVNFPDLGIDKITGQIFSKEMGGVTFYAGELSAYPSWRRQLDDGGWVTLDIKDWMDFPDMKNQKVPKIYETVDHYNKNRYVTTVVSVQSIKKLEKVSSDYFAIAPEAAAVVWDDDLHVFLKDDEIQRKSNR